MLLYLAAIAYYNARAAEAKADAVKASALAAAANKAAHSADYNASLDIERAKKFVSGNDLFNYLLYLIFLY